MLSTLSNAAGLGVAKSKFETAKMLAKIASDLFDDSLRAVEALQEEQQALLIDMRETEDEKPDEESLDNSVTELGKLLTAMHDVKFDIDGLDVIDFDLEGILAS